MTDSDRYSPDDYNADQIDEGVVEHQGTDKEKRVAGKRNRKHPRKRLGRGTAARAERMDNDQDKQKAGADATAKAARTKSFRAKTETKTPTKKPVAEKATAEKPSRIQPSRKQPRKRRQIAPPQTALVKLSSPIFQYHLFWLSLIRFRGRVVSCPMRDEV